MKIAPIFLLLFVNITCSAQSTVEYLQSILDSLEKIEPVSYSYESEGTTSAPYDTTAFRSHKGHIKTFPNSSDKLYGMAFSKHTQDWGDLHYDGKYAVTIYDEQRIVRIDTLINDTLPQLVAPFFVKVKSLLNYAIKHKDAAEILQEDFQDSTKFSFLFPGKTVELLGLRAFEWLHPDKNSRYILWIDSKTNLPFNLVRKMPHHHSSERISNLVLNDSIELSFNALLQVPPDYTINGKPKRDLSILNFEGELAPTWRLKEIAGDSVSLEDLSSKIILLKFTGVGCGPCHASLPFLKELSAELKSEDFEMVSIETWSKNLTGLQRYKEKNGIHYKFLVGDNNVKENYQIQGVPIFFLLNSERVIKKVILGYRKGETDGVIESAINDLI